MATRSALCAFDPEGDWFAYITADNRLKVWYTRANTGSLKVDFATPNHLSENISALAWGSIQSSNIKTEAPESAKKRKRDKEQIEKLKLVALGFKSGDILIYNVTAGKELQALKGSHTKAISDFVFSEDGKIGYSLGGDLVVQWDIATGKETAKWSVEKKGASSIVLTKDGKNLITAASTIKLWNLETQKNIQKWLGHTTPVRQLVLSPQSSQFISIAAEDRFVNIWSIQNTENENAVAALGLESVPLFVDAHQSLTGDKTTAFQVLALDESGQLFLWDNPLKGIEAEQKKKKKTIKSESKLTFVDENETPIPILAAKFTSTPAGPRIVLARGSFLKPFFESLTYTEENGQIIKETKFQRESQKGLLAIVDPKDRKEKGKEAEPKEGKAKEKRGPVTVVGSADFALPAQKIELHGEGLQGPTLEEKIRDLTVVEEKVVSTKTPKAGSLQQMLTQALQSNDAALLEQCLLVRDQSVIQKTVEKLPPAFVIPLLTQVIERFQKSPNRGAVLATWIRTTITTHTAYLMTVPNLVQKLSGLYQTVDSRLAVFKRLLRLSGRLELIITQISLRGTENESKEQEAHTVYNDDDEVSDEDAMGFGEDGDDQDTEPRGKKAKKAGKSSSGDNDDDMDEDMQSFDFGSDHEEPKDEEGDEEGDEEDDEADEADEAGEKEKNEEESEDDGDAEDED